jgi:hypothetical protein
VTIQAMLPAAPGLGVQVTAPVGADVEGVPPASLVVAWAVIEDVEAPGGARLDPVFLAAGQAWTPDQYRAAYGQQLAFRVVRAS